MASVIVHEVWDDTRPGVLCADVTITVDSEGTDSSKLPLDLFAETGFVAFSESPSGLLFDAANDEGCFAANGGNGLHLVGVNATTHKLFRKDFTGSFRGVIYGRL